MYNNRNNVRYLSNEHHVMVNDLKPFYDLFVLAIRVQISWSCERVF